VLVPRPRAVARVLSLVLVAAALVAVAPTPSDAADPVGQALLRLDQDADGALRIQDDGSGAVGFVGAPARTGLDNPAVKSSMSRGAAADAAITRYGAAVGTTQPGTTMARTGVQGAVTGDVVRYQQQVDGVPVLGGQVVVSLASDRELSSMLAQTSDATTVLVATVSEAAAAATAQTAFEKRTGPGDEVTVQSDGRWLLDAGLIGGDSALGDRTVWRLHVSRGVDERRQILVDDRTGGILMDTDEIAHADRVVCDDNNVRQSSDVPCTAGFARVEGGAASGIADVNAAYDLSGVVADFYQQVGGIDLTSLLGISVGGVQKLASTVRWCYTGTANACPYKNAFWNGSQMFYGSGFAAADDVVGHEMTHGFTEHNSGLFYWGQSGAMNESISDIIGEIVDHRHPSAGDSATNWDLGEDIPGYPQGFRNMQDPTLRGDPDKTSSSFYADPERCSDPSDANTCYPDNDGVHTNSGVGNKTFYLISQGGTFNGHTVTGIDAGDATLSKSAHLWLLVDQSLSSASGWAEEADVLDQSCQALVSGAVAGFTAADCTQVHEATLATQLRTTPANNPQATGVGATCPGNGVPQTLFDSEAGTPETKFVAGATWGRSSELAHSGTTSWVSTEPTTIGASSLTASTGIALPADRSSFLIFDRWHVLDYDDFGFYDALTVEIDDTGDGSAPQSAESLPWAYGPNQIIASGYGNPAAGRFGFGGDSRGYVASRVDLTSYAGKTVKPQFTMNTDNSLSYVGLALDDIVVYTCPLRVANVVAPTITGTPQIGEPLTAHPGTWDPEDAEVTYQWVVGGSDIPGATGQTYTPTLGHGGAHVAVRVSATDPVRGATSVMSAPTAAVAPGAITPGAVSVTGSAAVGGLLTADPGSWSPDEVVLEYQWLRNGAPIGAATESTYAPVAADVGTDVAVRVTGSRTGYTTADASSSGIEVVPGTITPGAPTVTGTPAVGSTLTVSSGSWAPGGLALTYEWLHNGVSIAGATGSTYVPVAADVGTQVAVRVTGTRSGYTTAASTSSGIEVVPGTITAGTPTITGTPAVGSTLTASPGSWGPGSVTLTYQWLRDGAPISGATGATYFATVADIGKTLSARVTGSNPGFAPTTATSAPTGPVARGTLVRGKPTVTGKAAVGRTLKLKAGTWQPSGVTLHYQWLRNGKPIARATKTTYRLTSGDAGKRISVKVTGSRTGYSSTTATSKATGKVKAKPKKRH
jgi:Zn-dependent metalloprotease